MKYDIFISYARKDFEEVNRFVGMLKKCIPSLTYWFDITGIESGDDFEDKIIKAIDNSAYVLFALSDNSLQSQWTKNEVMYAKNSNKKIIPLLLKDAELKDWFLFKFGSIDCIDTTNPLHIEKLVKNLSDWKGKGSIDPPPTSGGFSPESPSWKKWVIPLAVCATAALVILFWQKSGDNKSRGNGETDRLAVLSEARTDTVPNVPNSEPDLLSQSGNMLKNIEGQAHAPQNNKTKVGGAATSLLYVTTNPSDATVYIDSKKVGTSPIEAKDVSRGNHTVKLSKKGYKEKNFTRTFGEEPVILNETLVVDYEFAYQTGEDYYYGRNGKDQSYSEAVKWYRKAAEQGHASAQCNLGYCYRNGQGVEKSDSEAAQWYRKAAEQGHASAQYNLGVCYDLGRGVKQSYSEAVKWYHKAANQGYASAQYNLGVCYDLEHGVEQSEQSSTEAVKWYHKAAEQGHASAQYSLGICYSLGRGVEQSNTEAVKWLRKAAEQGDKDAKKALKELEN